MDKNKFWLGGRLFNTASPRLGGPTQRKARRQDGRPNATQGTSASWAPQRNARHVRKMGAQTQRKARPQVGHPNATQGTSASWAPQRTSATQTQGTSASWAPRRNARHVRKMGAQTQRKASSQDGRPNEKLIRNENVHTREH
jgi:hypothetical protein